MAEGPRFIPFQHILFLFLPTELSLELPRVFTRKPSNNTLDLGVWPDHRHGLLYPTNHPSSSLALVSLFSNPLKNVYNNPKVCVIFSFPVFFSLISSWENSCQWMQCPFQIQYYANCISANGVNKYVHEVSGGAKSWAAPMQRCRPACFHGSY